ncbi:MAG: cryptochrome/photolyase family protein [Myxococcota bacterium]
MSEFTDRLAELQPDDRLEDPGARSWVYAPYDQLTDQIGPLARRPPAELGLVVVENPWKASRRPYHKQKLALVLTNMRHFALEQAERGVAIRYEVADGPYHTALGELADELGPLQMMQAAERELRADLAPLIEDGALQTSAHEGWLTDHEQFLDACGEPPWRMDAFYRRVRQDSGILMEDGSPAGGQYSHDGANREFWPGEPPAPSPPEFEVDDITREVGELVSKRFAAHPGTLQLERIPATRRDAEAHWQWALDNCMACFGPFEDAMSTESRTLFHTRLSWLLNLHRVLPARVVADVASLDIPINSKEGFIRQVLGWREFMHHVHDETDGFRTLDGVDTREAPGDAGYSRWSGESWAAIEDSSGIDGGAEPNELGADFELPTAFWGETSGLFCLDHVVEGVLEHGYSHHIPRLMILSNIATLLDVRPRELTDWFWVAYTDAYDWVVEPNVLGMGTFGVGELFTTKPYVSGSNYIDKMSDYCDACAFDPAKDCPLRDMYWAFLERHREHLSDNRRMRLMYGNLKRRSDPKKARDKAVFEAVRERLANGEPVTPDDISALNEEHG